MEIKDDKICPKCRTGRKSYLLDARSPMCPYIGCHSGKACAGFNPQKDKGEKEPPPGSRTAGFGER